MTSEQQTPILTAVVAMDRNRVIGVNGDLPWRLPADLKFFKRVTLHKPIIMGRKTYASIGRPLPKRKNIVMTRDSAFEAEGCIIVHSVEEALAACGQAPEVMIIGGAEIYRLFLPHINKMHITHVDTEVEGDTIFPVIDLSSWQVEASERYDQDDRHPFSFEIVTCRKK